MKRLNAGIQPNTARVRISSQKARGVSWEELEARQSQMKSTEQQEFVQVYRGYQLALASSNLLDYDDLLLRCADLLRQHPECVSNVQAVLVDEFQDTNQIQFDLMNLFASRNKRITIVGDPDQSIYGFRSAEIKNLARMQKLYKDTSVSLLQENYRSSASILRSAQDVIEQDTSRPAKKLHPTHCVGTMPVLRKLPTAAAEAQWLVMEIKRCIAMTGKLLNYSDFAILLRSASLSRRIESELGKEGIPYRMVGGSRFFDRVEVKILLDYLRVVSQPGNSDALLRIINVPSRKIGDESVKLLSAGAEEAQQPLWNFIKDVAQGRRSTKKNLSKSADQGLSVLVGLIETSRHNLLEYRDDSAPRKLLEFIIRKLAFKEYLKTTYPLDEDNRWANVEELLAQAGDASGSEPEQDDSLPEIEGIEQQQAHPGEEALARFLANVALSTEITSEEGDQPQEKVTISTIHAAKGLEWPVVFVPAVYEGIIPHSRAEDSDEERRLLYVAMTRAQALLYLSFPRRDSTNSDETTPTSFLPQKIIDYRFRLTGPKFRVNEVCGIAEILRRPPPSAEDVQKAMDGLARVNDDLWTADGEEHPDTVTRWDGSRAIATEDQQPFPKRRRFDEKPDLKTSTYVSSSTYTMNNPANFSMPSTLSLGFSTARQHMAMQPQAEEDQPGSKEKGAKTAGRKAGGLTQGSISSFFGQQSGPKHQVSKQPSLANPRQSQSGEIGQFSHSQVSTGVSGRAVPQTLLNRRVQSQRVTTSRPILESSDPNRYTWLSSSSRPALESRDSLVKSKEEVERVDDDVKSSSAPVSGVRPATTYHTTTMSMVNQMGSTTGRKTLGIRRSMNGWAERMNRAGNGKAP